jgi:hypothetical protein
MTSSGGTVLNWGDERGNDRGKGVGPLTLTRNSTTDFDELAQGQSLHAAPHHGFGANGVSVPTWRPAQNLDVLEPLQSEVRPGQSLPALLFWIGLVILVCYWLIRANRARFG